eukprot:2325778-Pleurochrysis_carterae.AAC.1
MNAMLACLTDACAHTHVESQRGGVNLQAPSDLCNETQHRRLKHERVVRPTRCRRFAVYSAGSSCASVLRPSANRRFAKFQMRTSARAQRWRCDTCGFPPEPAALLDMLSHLAPITLDPDLGGRSARARLSLRVSNAGHPDSNLEDAKTKNKNK